MAEVKTVAQLENEYPGTRWRYTGEVATRKHAVPVGTITDHEVRDTAQATCGTTPRVTTWMGTGNQREYEKNDRLPPCGRCLTKLMGSSFGRRAHFGQPSR
jgi:bacterioferritin-associated ferredoxin